MSLVPFYAMLICDSQFNCLFLCGTTNILPPHPDQIHIPSHSSSTCSYTPLLVLAAHFPASPHYSQTMASFRPRRLVEHEAFHPGQLSAHQRKYGMSIRVRGRAHEDVSKSWYFACKEADINLHRPGAYGPAKEDMAVRFARFRRDLPTEGSRWMACQSLGIPRALLRRRAINRQQHRQKLGGADPAVVRGRCAPIGKRCVSPPPPSC